MVTRAIEIGLGVFAIACGSSVTVDEVGATKPLEPTPDACEDLDVARFAIARGSSQSQRRGRNRPGRALPLAS
jgi:hypothetical protein